MDWNIGMNYIQLKEWDWYRILVYSRWHHSIASFVLSSLRRICFNECKATSYIRTECSILRVTFDPHDFEEDVWMEANMAELRLVSEYPHSITWYCYGEIFVLFVV